MKKVDYSKIHTVRDLIDNSAEAYGDKSFIKYLSGEKIIEKSFTELRENSLAICRYIRSVCPDKMHIAVIGKTTYEYITVLTGILISGNVFVPFAPNISAEEAVRLFEAGDIDAVFYESEFDDKVKEISRKYKKLKTIVNMGNSDWFTKIYKKYSSTSEYAKLSEIELDPKKCATIIFTSGTTGNRKGVMLSSDNLISNVTYPEFDLKQNEVYLSVLPMHHIFCFSCDYFKPLLDGVTVCLSGDISNIGKSLQIFQPTTMRAVPMICDTLIKKVVSLQKKNPELTNREAAEKVFGKNLSWIGLGGAYLPLSLIEEYEKYGIKIRQGYGMTETGPKVSLADFGENYKDSSGTIIKSICDVRIVDGEIQVKGKSVMMGYYKMPEETAAVFTDDGYLKTGDLGRISDDGEHLYVTGRIKNLIILSNGENVSPEELERKFADEKTIKEIVVRAENDRIIAEIYPDFDYVKEAGIKDIEEYLERKIEEANEGERTEKEISGLLLRDTPFPKTSTNKIKRDVVRF